MACEDVVFVQVRGATEQTPSEAPKNNDLLLNEVRTTRAYVSVARTVCQHEPGCLPIASEETRGPLPVATIQCCGFQETLQVGQDLQRGPYTAKPADDVLSSAARACDRPRLTHISGACLAI